MPLHRVDRGRCLGCTCARRRGALFTPAAYRCLYVFIDFFPEQTISVLLMTCVGYDHDFAADFSSFKDYEPRPPTVKGSKAAKAKSTQQQNPTSESDSRSVNSNESFVGHDKGAGELEQVRRQQPQRRRNAPQRFMIDVDSSLD